MTNDIYLRKKEDFDKVYKKRKIYGNKNLTLYLKKNDIGYSRMGFSISKKVGNAVTRNLLKRRLKHIFRENLDRVPNGFDAVIVVKKSSSEISFNELKNSFFHLMRKASN